MDSGSADVPLRPHLSFLPLPFLAPPSVPAPRSKPPPAARLLVLLRRRPRTATAMGTAMAPVRFSLSPCFL
jgi:hypothetical protein